MTVRHATAPDGTRVGAHVSGRGPPLVLVHGTGADHARWAPVVAALGEEHTLYAVDRRGRGASGDTLPYEMAREFEDVAAVVDLAASESGGPVDLLGHSYGGLCSLGAALRTGNLGRLLLYEPPFLVEAGTYPPGFLDGLDDLVARGRNEEALLRFFREVVGVPEEHMQRLRTLEAWPARVRAAPTITRECRAEGSRPLALRDLVSLRVPVLLLEGTDSPDFLRDSVQVLRDALPQSRVATMRGQGHAAIDTGTDLFLHEVRDFLERTPPLASA